MKNQSTQADPFFCAISTEFCQLWDHDLRIGQIASLGLGNMAILSNTFHVGNSDEDRAKWKRLYPELAREVDATPKFPDRPEHGMCRLLNPKMEVWIKQFDLCRKLGLKVFMHPVNRNELSAEDRARLGEAGRGVVVSDMIMGEATSMLGHGYTMERLKKIDAMSGKNSVEQAVELLEKKGDGKPDAASIFDHPERLDYQIMHDWFVGRFQKVAKRVGADGVTILSAIEATIQMRLAMQAGATLPILELVPAEPITGMAATRGAARAYNAPMWGVHMALGYYRAPTDLWTPERLQIALNLFYAAGASWFSEPNIAFQNWGSCSAFFTEAGSPPIRLGEKECREFDDPICVRGREVLAEHFRFMRFHERPKDGPRVPLGFVIGRLDGYTSEEQTHVWCVEGEGFASGPAEKTWRHFQQLYDSENWYTPPRKYYWQADPSKPLRHGTPPCGQLDIVPIEASLELLQSYGCLVFLGWNTMTPEDYAKLKAFVHAGGRLVMAAPHLSTRTRNDQPPAFINEGDVSELFGVRITGPGEQIEEVIFTQQTTDERYVFPVNTLYLEPTKLAKLELRGARVIARPRGKETPPVFVEHRYGKGTAYLLATWDYPGTQLDAFITDILRTVAEGEQGDIAVQGQSVEYAVYDTQIGGRAAQQIYLTNKSIYGQPQYPLLMVRGNSVRLRLGGSKMRIAWLLGDLLVSPESKFVKVVDAKADAGVHTIALVAEPGEHRIQLAAIGAGLLAVTLDGKPVTLNTDQEGATSFVCDLQARSELHVTVGQ